MRPKYQAKRSVAKGLVWMSKLLSDVLKSTCFFEMWVLFLALSLLRNSRLCFGQKKLTSAALGESHTLAQ